MRVAYAVYMRVFLSLYTYIPVITKIFLKNQPGKRDKKITLN